MRLALSFAALFLSVILLQLHSGAMGPLDALSGVEAGFSQAQIGMLGSAHFVGFFIGCWGAPRLMGSTGHIRAFSAFAATGAIGAMAHPLIIDPLVWSILRVMTGLALAGCYTVIEAWLQAKVTNETRGRTLGIYRFVDLGASLVAQLLIGVLDPVSYVSYNILAILCCAALLPLLLTTAKPPRAPDAPRLRPMAAIRLSPLGAAGVIVAGVTMPAFRMVGALYGQQVGLAAEQIGLFLAVAILGGAVAQFPAGWLADKYDRRWVLIGASVMSVFVCGATSLMGGASVSLVFVTGFLFGVATMPVFSISSAHASDYAEPEEMVELSASLMFLYGVGAIASPFLAATLISAYGPGAMFGMIAIAHLGLVVFGFYRMTVREGVGRRAPYAYVPRTTFILGRFLRRNGRKD